MFKCEIRTGNAAFGEDDFDEGYEIARILRGIADEVENGSFRGNCIDVNGNRVGDWSR